jgi:DedD protein
MMETAVKERLVGAAVLVALVVIVVPALLSGPPEPPQEPPAGDGTTRSVEIEIAPPRTAADEEPLPEALADPPVLRNAVKPSAPARGEPKAPEQAPVVTEAAAKSPGNAAGQAPASPSPAATSTGAWAVQIAAFSSGDAAQRMVADLRRRGYAAFAMEFRADGRALHRVRVGPETGRDRADALAARLQGEGFKATVVAHP